MLSLRADLFDFGSRVSFPRAVEIWVLERQDGILGRHCPTALLSDIGEGNVVDL